MNSLFVRTLLWFIATVILTFMALTVATALDVDPEERRRGPFGALVNLGFRDAVYSYETGGADRLKSTLERFRAVTENQGLLTDRFGRDLVTGEDRSDLVREFRRRGFRPIWARNRTVVGRQSATGRYMFFMVMERGSFARWFLQPEIPFSALGVLVLLSYAFARRLTNPVRQLRDAVDRFGKGDLGIRLNSRRRDELGHLARTFDQMADRIETLLGAERRLLLDISHELRSPLARLALATELARSDQDPSRHLDRIEREAERLNALVSELLQVTRAEGDAARMRFEPVSLDAVANEVIEDARLEAGARGLRVEWGAREKVEIEGDAELLRRAMENIVRNALRYAPADTAVQVSVASAGGQPLVSVRDQGPGVPESELSRIFDAFYRVGTDRDRASGGAGLGLAIARRAVELHRGSMQAKNASPGLLVEIRLPRGGSI